MTEAPTPPGSKPDAAGLPTSGPAPYPLGLRLRGRRVVVIGGGVVATRRLPALFDAGADVLLVAPWVTPAVESWAGAGRLRWEPRSYETGDLGGTWLTLALTDDPEVNAEVAAAAERGQVFCVRADDAAQASAWTPAVGRHDGITVAVQAGRDPRRAGRLRDAVVERLSDGSLDAAPVRGRAPVPGVALVGAGPGDPELITVRGRRLLSRADVVVVDRLAPGLLLDELPAHVEVIDATKIPYGRLMTQDAINAALVAHAREGRFVVRLKGGDPFVFGRGGEELHACLVAGIPVEVVPGVTSAVAVPAAAGIPVTHRGVTHEVVVVSGHLAPDDPQSLVDWSALGRLRGTVVLLMAVERLDQIAASLIAHGRAASTPVAVVQDGTTAAQRHLFSSLDRVAEAARDAGFTAPAVVVVGDVVGVGAEFAALAAVLR